jgi:hypothetical protein
MIPMLHGRPIAPIPETLTFSPSLRAYKTPSTSFLASPFLSRRFRLKPTESVARIQRACKHRGAIPTPLKVTAPSLRPRHLPHSLAHLLTPLACLIHNRSTLSSSIRSTLPPSTSPAASPPRTRKQSAPPVKLPSTPRPAASRLSLAVIQKWPEAHR